MSITLPHNVKSQQEATDTQRVEVCALGHPLDDCPARRAGCNNHYQMLHFMFPPLQVLTRVRASMGDDPDVRRWLDNMDRVLPGRRPGKGGR